jgi:hypothetical protein
MLFANAVVSLFGSVSKAGSVPGQYYLFLRNYKIRKRSSNLTTTVRLGIFGRTGVSRFTNEVFDRANLGVSDVVGTLLDITKLSLLYRKGTNCQ